MRDWNLQLKHDTSLVLRVCNADFTSRGGFQWPSEIGAVVSAPDWKANYECGNGLHGWLHGSGDYSASDYCGSPEAKWMVLEVPSSEIIDLGGKVKFPSATVRFIGSKSDAAEFILKNDPAATADTIIGLSLTAGDNRSVSVGDLGTATAGKHGTASAGEYGSASAGYRGSAFAGEDGTASAGKHGTATAGRYGSASAGKHGTATAGKHGTATAGKHGTATAGEDGTATAGKHGSATAGRYGSASAGYRGSASAGEYGTASAGRYGTAIAGDYGTASAGNRGTASAGEYGSATAGEDGTATAGEYGSASAGDYGVLMIKYWDSCRDRYAVAYVGENGILPNVKYKLDDNHNFVVAE